MNKVKIKVGLSICGVAATDRPTDRGHYSDFRHTVKAVYRAHRLTIPLSK